MSKPICRNCGQFTWRFETAEQREEFYRTGLCNVCQEAFPWDRDDEVSVIQQIGRSECG